MVIKSVISNKKSVSKGDAMKSKTIIKLTLAAAIVALPTTGCAGILKKQSNISSTADAGDKKAAKWAAKADKYLADGDIDKAVINAERAVDADFHNSAYRSTLARGYLAQGRFNSAERTLQDVIDLGQKDPRTIISLALLRTSQGRTASAISMLNSYRDILPEGDYGLALAVAGDRKNSIEALESGVRNSNTAQLRQNLALAYALNGQWREARAMASQDLTGSQVNENISKWAQYARPNAYQERVAGLLGINPREDDGQPARLALESRSNPNIDFATNSSNGELAATGPAPTSLVDNVFSAKESNVKVSTTSQPAQDFRTQTSSTQSTNAPSAPSKFIVEDENGTFKGSVPKQNISNSTASKPAKPVLAKTVSNNDYMIQLGAFSSSKNAQAAWSKLTNEHSVLKPYRSANNVVNSKGRKLYRLTAMGFKTQATANSVCIRIKAKGGSCLVRKNEGSTAVRLARK